MHSSTMTGLKSLKSAIRTLYIAKKKKNRKEKKTVRQLDGQINQHKKCNVASVNFSIIPPHCRIFEDQNRQSCKAHRVH